jgi:hypothetical protein
MLIKLKFILFALTLMLSCREGFCQFDKDFNVILTVLCSSNDNLEIFNSSPSLFLYMNKIAINHVDDYYEFHRVTSNKDDMAFDVSPCQGRNLKIIIDPFFSKIYFKDSIKSILVVKKLNSRDSKFEIAITTVGSKREKSFPYKKYLISYSEDMTVLDVKESKSKFIKVMY